MKWRIWRFACLIRMPLFIPAQGTLNKFGVNPFMRYALSQNAYLAMRSQVIPAKTVDFDDGARKSILMFLL
jgi:hypothetical protein